MSTIPKLPVPALDKILKFINLGFIHSTNKLLSANHVPGNVPGACEGSVNKATLVRGAYVLRGRKTINKKPNE